MQPYCKFTLGTINVMSVPSHGLFKYSDIRWLLNPYGNLSRSLPQIYGPDDC
jgi:hypothetical protein